MSKIVRTWNDIRNNLLELEKYRTSKDEAISEYYRGLIRRGSCFVGYYFNNKILFGPSRFIGYVSNNRSVHERNKYKDGKETNLAIQNILQIKFTPDPVAESLFLKYCKRHKIIPQNKKRKFVKTESLIINATDILLSDLAEIRSCKDIKETEKERLVQARMGQGEYRKRILRLWNSCCPVTGCREPLLLRASHIKPWRECSNDERLDGYNGILLSPNCDAAFDKGLISFSDKGRLILSPKFSSRDIARLGIKTGTRIKLHNNHLPYLSFHRGSILQ